MACRCPFFSDTCFRSNPESGFEILFIRKTSLTKMFFGSDRCQASGECATASRSCWLWPSCRRRNSWRELLARCWRQCTSWRLTTGPDQTRSCYLHGRTHWQGSCGQERTRRWQRRQNTFKRCATFYAQDPVTGGRRPHRRAGGASTIHARAGAEGPEASEAGERRQRRVP